jgi:hypothetical protein
VEKLPVVKAPTFIRNPLTVIGVFAGLSEMMALWVLPKLQAAAADIFLWFVMGFPVLLVVAFFVTLNFNHKCLYAPSDYRGDEAFIALARQIQKEVYAKADVVNRLALGVARVIAFGVSRGQRLAGPNLDHLLLEELNRLSTTLRETGISEKEITKAVSPLTSMIEFDLASNVATDAVYALRGERKGQAHPKENEASKHVQKALQKSRPGHEAESVRGYLESLNVWDEKIQAGVNELKYFRETGKLHPLPEGEDDDE